MRSRLLPLSALLLVALTLSGAGEGGAALSPAEAEDYLAQSNCLDADGRAQPGVLPFQPACSRRAVLRWPDGMAYRKHDWPAPEHRAGAPLGYQASDAYLTRLRGRPAVVQTFDFGTSPYAFGRFDAGADGGDAVILGEDGASIGLSEDSDGVKWLLGRGCTPGGPFAPGWLVFQGSRGERIAPNAIAAGPEACPRAFTMSLTRWHRARLSLPYLIRGERAGTFAADVIVSEHYTHVRRERSNAMERFLFARGLGKVRWEAWVNLDHPGADAARWSAQAAWFAGTGRCPPLEEVTGPNAPGRRNWVLTECRTWTNFDPAPPGALLPAFGWPAQIGHQDPAGGR